MTPAVVLTAILLAFPNTPARACLIARRATIEAALTEAHRVYPAIPPELLASVGFGETHLGCARGEAGGWGAPASRTQRHTAGTPLDAARALDRSLTVCRTVHGALRRFRTGLCDPARQSSRPDVLGPIGDRYAREVLRRVERMRETLSARPSCSRSPRGRS